MFHFKLPMFINVFLLVSYTLGNCGWPWDQFLQGLHQDIYCQLYCKRNILFWFEKVTVFTLPCSSSFEAPVKVCLAAFLSISSSSICVLISSGSCFCPSVGNTSKPRSLLLEVGLANGIFSGPRENPVWYWWTWWWWCCLCRLLYGSRRWGR